jgi:hypothetical protein
MQLSEIQHIAQVAEKACAAAVNQTETCVKTCSTCSDQWLSWHG